VGFALGASVAAHAVAATLAGVLLPAMLAHESGESLIEVDLARLDPAVPADPPPALPLPVPVPAPVPERPAPRIRSAASARPPAGTTATTVATPAPAASEAPASPTADAARLVFSAGTLRTQAAVEASVGRETLAEGTGPGGGADEVFGERDLTTKARVLLQPEPAYPAEARRAEIEADVPVEILLDRDGHVLQARSLSHQGYGLDEAATRAIRTWTFSPALRAGRPVRVRMTWTVRFRLR
jgi:protein TonB